MNTHIQINTNKNIKSLNELSFINSGGHGTNSNNLFIFTLQVQPLDEINTKGGSLVDCWKTTWALLL